MVNENKIKCKRNLIVSVLTEIENIIFVFVVLFDWCKRISIQAKDKLRATCVCG